MTAGRETPKGADTVESSEPTENFFAGREEREEREGRDGNGTYVPSNAGRRLDRTNGVPDSANGIPGSVSVVSEDQNFPTTSSRIAVYPGSFDPVTLGHLNVMERASQLFDRLVIGIGVNSEKTPMFSVPQRMELIRLSTTHLPNVEVQSFDGLAVNFVRHCGARVMIRGVRPITDIPAEITMMMANRRLAPDVETLFMIADGELAHVSSSLIKEIYRLTDGESLCRFLPLPVTRAIHERLRMGE